ncbi:MAG: alpha/beta fold hydrolase [Egibacteraceae bacterium]
MSRQATCGLIDVGGAKLYHEVRGRGPAVLFITGGTGDAGEWAHIAPRLADELTVVTYDRRGFSRSPRPDGWTSTSMVEQAGDAARLLRALGLAPAVVVGHSSGGSIACRLVIDHPEIVRHAVIYEAPLFAVVPGGEEIATGLRALAGGGPRTGMERFMRRNAGDEVADMFAALFDIELPALTSFVPDRKRMRTGGVPLTVVVGEQDRDTWFGAASRWLTEGTEADLVELPGGHAGFVTHPKEFAELVRRIARKATRTPAGRVDTQAVETFRQRLRGPLLTPGDPGFRDATLLWNGLISKTPALAVQPTGTADVVAVVDFARDHGLALSVRGGGHNVAGTAVADGG